MDSVDWFRNQTWNEEVERSFNQKLLRARKRDQYLCIQAFTLKRSHPEIALKLLDRFFALKEEFFHAVAYVYRADALIALSRIAEAVESYEAALARESEFPGLETPAYLDLPYLIATQPIEERFTQAIELLEKHKSRLFLVVDHFRWHTARALVAFHQTENLLASNHAGIALEWAGRKHSGLRFHPAVGRVSEGYDGIVKTLEEIRSCA